MKRLIGILLALTIFMVGSPVAWADSGECPLPRRSEAFEELCTKVEQGDAGGQYNLGSIYMGQADYKEATKWFRKAADQGHAKARYRLGSMYEEGEGFLQNYEEAVKWYRKAAEWGYRRAQGKLAEMYREGKGVPRDLVKTHMWYYLAAADEGFSFQRERDEVSELHHSTMRDAKAILDMASKQMSPEKIAEARRLARKCLARNYENC